MRITLEKLEKFSNKKKAFIAFSNYPPVLRDLSVLLHSDINAGDIEETIRKSPLKGLLKSIELYDIFTLPGQDEKISYTFGLKYQADDRTLTGDEVNKLHEQVINNLQKKLKAELRN